MCALHLELVGVAKVLEHLRDLGEQARDCLAAEERVEGHGAVKDDLLGEQPARRSDVVALDGLPEAGRGRMRRAGPAGRARR